MSCYAYKMGKVCECYGVGDDAKEIERVVRKEREFRHCEYLYITHADFDMIEPFMNSFLHVGFSPCLGHTLYCDALMKESYRLVSLNLLPISGAIPRLLKFHLWFFSRLFLESMRNPFE